MNAKEIWEQHPIRVITTACIACIGATAAFLGFVFLGPLSNRKTELVQQVAQLEAYQKETEDLIGALHSEIGALKQENIQLHAEANQRFERTELIARFEAEIAALDKELEPLRAEYDRNKVRLEALRPQCGPGEKESINVLLSCAGLPAFEEQVASQEGVIARKMSRRQELSGRLDKLLGGS